MATMDIFSDPDDNYKTGYIRVYRSIKNHWLYEPNRKRTRLEAWYDLLLQAKHSDYKEAIGYDLIVVKRGQILTSQDKLSREWKWDRGAVRLFLRSLHLDGMIVSDPTSKYTMITICNYDVYQANQPSTPPTNQHQSNSTTTTYNKLNNDNTLKKIGTKVPIVGEQQKKEDAFVKMFNEITERDFKKLDEKSSRQFKNLLKDGYTGKDFKKTIKIALSEMTGRGRQNYLTPEFITRSAEFSKYFNMAKAPAPAAEPVSITINHDDRA